MDNYFQYLKDRKNKMIEYLLLKVKEEDWHGVADAAMDIRDIESEKLGAEKVIGLQSTKRD